MSDELFRTNLDYLEDMSNAYRNFRKKDPAAGFALLEGVVDYCKYLKFDLNKTQIMIGMITGCEPKPGQSWRDVRPYDDDEVQFNKKLVNEMGSNDH